MGAPVLRAIICSLAVSSLMVDMRPVRKGHFLSSFYFTNPHPPSDIFSGPIVQDWVPCSGLRAITAQWQKRPGELAPASLPQEDWFEKPEHNQALRAMGIERYGCSWTTWRLSHRTSVPPPSTKKLSVGRNIMEICHFLLFVFLFPDFQKWVYSLFIIRSKETSGTLGQLLGKHPTKKNGVGTHGGSCPKWA